MEYSEVHRALVAVSIVRHKSDVDLHTWLGIEGNDIEQIKAALRAASSLLPYYAWLYMDDRSPWNLVVSASPDGSFSIFDIDHDWGAMCLVGSTNLWIPPTGGWLDDLLNSISIDTRAVRDTVDRIEAVSRRDVDEIFASLPHSGD